MIHVVTTENVGAYADQIMQMHRLRYRVFAKRMNWEVQTNGDMEFDVYDAMSPVYLLSLSDDGDVRGCLRLLPTTGPYMLKDVFPVLLGKSEPPCDPLILESSRFAVDHEMEVDDRAAGIARATSELFLGIVEYGLPRGMTHIVTVVDRSMEVLIRRGKVGWTRLAEPAMVGNSMAVAGLGEISEEALIRMRRQAKVEESVLHQPEHVGAAA